jgi:DNA-directed RNA polymerase specialized sigma24 family protein
MTIENEDDRGKVTELYRCYSRTMLYIAKGILHDNSLAEDALSEAFIHIIDNLEKYLESPDTHENPDALESPDVLENPDILKSPDIFENPDI